jgi:hypothetical protein
MAAALAAFGQCDWRLSVSAGKVPIPRFSPLSAPASCDTFDEKSIPRQKLFCLSSFTSPSFAPLNLPRRLATMANALSRMIIMGLLLLLLLWHAIKRKGCQIGVCWTHGHAYAFMHALI